MARAGGDSVGCGLVILIGVLSFIGVKFGVGLGAALLIFIAVVIVLCAIAWAVAEPCANCGSKAGSDYTHRRVDGGPDRRYHNNPIRCRSCGAHWHS